MLVQHGLVIEAGNNGHVGGVGTCQPVQFERENRSEVSQRLEQLLTVLPGVSR